MTAGTILLSWTVGLTQRCTFLGLFMFTKTLMISLELDAGIKTQGTDSKDHSSFFATVEN